MVKGWDDMGCFPATRAPINGRKYMGFTGVLTPINVFH